MRALIPLALLLFASSCSLGPVGTLRWTESTGGALTGGEKFSYIFAAVPELSKASLTWVFSSQPAKLSLAELAPPETPVVREAWRRLSLRSDPAFVNHSIRTAYWTIAAMRLQKRELSPQEIEEAWVAALLHDIGLAEPPAQGEFTLGGVAVVRQIAAQLGWPKESVDRASEAITLNPNSRVDREKNGLIAWAMNVGGQGETFHSPYSIILSGETVRELEAKYPRLELPRRSSEILSREFQRFPNQRFHLLKSIGFLLLVR